MNHAYVVDGTFQLIGDDLAQRGCNALAHGVASGIQHDLAGVIDLDAGVFPGADAAGFDEAADADADGAAFHLCRSNFLFPLVIADFFQRSIHLADKIAGIINHIMKRMFAQVIGHFFMPYQIAPAHVRRI